MRFWQSYSAVTWLLVSPPDSATAPAPASSNPTVAARASERRW